MDDPVVDIEGVIYNLTTGPSDTQQNTLEKYFTPNASFNHPFCSVKNNRRAILRIFQWYKILSPHIALQINSIAYDEQNLILYVNISQTFAIWFVPFHASHVTLTTVLQLARGSNLNLLSPTTTTTHPQRYYITSQNDLYQVEQFVRFFAPWGIGSTIVGIWHWIATLFCVVGATLLQPWQWVFAEVSRPLKEPTGSREVSPTSRETMMEHAREMEETINRRLAAKDGDAGWQ